MHRLEELQPQGMGLVALGEEVGHVRRLFDYLSDQAQLVDVLYDEVHVVGGARDLHQALEPA